MQRRPRRLNLYGTDFRIARAVLDLVAGLDPGAVRLAQMVVSLISDRRRSSP